MLGFLHLRGETMTFSKVSTQMCYKKLLLLIYTHKISFFSKKPKS